MIKKIKKAIRDRLYWLTYTPVQLEDFRAEFQKKFPNTRLRPVNIFDLDKVEVGKFSYGDLNVLMWANPNQKLIIGNCISIASNVVFILGGNHRYDSISTYPFSVEIYNEELNENDETLIELSNGPITIKDDVWIGTGAHILSGVTVHQGAIVAACSVVTKDVPPYAIVGGNPARVIKFRFEDKIIERLLEKADYSNITLEKIKIYKELLYTPITLQNIDNILKVF